MSVGGTSARFSRVAAFWPDASEERKARDKKGVSGDALMMATDFGPEEQHNTPQEVAKRRTSV